MAKIGRNIREQRMKKGLSQEELAERLYVTRQTISNYETGRSDPDVEMLTRLAEALDTDIQLLIYGEPKKHDPQGRFCTLCRLPAFYGALFSLIFSDEDLGLGRCAAVPGKDDAQLWI